MFLLHHLWPNHSFNFYEVFVYAGHVGSSPNKFSTLMFLMFYPLSLTLLKMCRII